MEEELDTDPGGVAYPIDGILELEFGRFQNAFVS
jgi:hypothetical protein